MHVFFEDDGQLKAGTVLADNDTSLQVESASGKRLKIKAAAVLLRFSDPSPAALNVEAHKLAGELDPDFLWEVSGEAEFGFADLAREYYGRSPAPPESAAVALALAHAPMYFYKRGKGRYRKAPADALKAALASVERKLRDSEQMASWEGELRAHRLPEALRRKAADAAPSPRQERARVEGAGSGVRGAAYQSGRAARAVRRDPVVARLSLQRVPRPGVSARASSFRRGEALPALPELPRRRRARFLDRRSHDDRDRRRVLGARARRTAITRSASTSPRRRLSIARGSPLDADRARAPVDRLHAGTQDHDAAARSRSTAFTLAEGRSPPALSLYAEVARRRRAGSSRDARRIAFRSPPTCASTRSARRSRTICRHRRIRRGRRASRAVDVRADARGAARQGRFPADRLQLLRRLGRGAGRQGRDRSAAARLAARQGRRRAHDLRQQHLGQGARGRPRRRPLSDAVERQGEDEHASGRASGPRARALPVGELAACAATATSSTSGS